MIIDAKFDIGQTVYVIDRQRLMVECGFCVLGKVTLQGKEDGVWTSFTCPSCLGRIKTSLGPLMVRPCQLESFDIYVDEDGMNFEYSVTGASPGVAYSQDDTFATLEEANKAIADHGLSKNLEAAEKKAERRSGGSDHHTP